MDAAKEAARLTTAAPGSRRTAAGPADEGGCADAAHAGAAGSAAAGAADPAGAAAATGELPLGGEEAPSEKSGHALVGSLEAEPSSMSLAGIAAEVLAAQAELVLASQESGPGPVDGGMDAATTAAAQPPAEEAAVASARAVVPQASGDPVVEASLLAGERAPAAAPVAADGEAAGGPGPEDWAAPDGVAAQLVQEQLLRHAAAALGLKVGATGAALDGEAR